MAVDTYEVTWDDVDAFLIWDLQMSDHPTLEQVETWITLGAAELHAHIGDLAEPCAHEAFTVRARHIVALYAAAMAEDAHYPERALDRAAGSYGALLWARWKELTTSLTAAVDDCRDGVQPGGPGGGAAHSFPSPPMFTRTMGF